MKIIENGVCAPKGFLANGIHCGIRKSKKDLALVYSIRKANAAAIYTKNLVKGAPLLISKIHLADGRAQAIICNSGNANTCNPDGLETASAMCSILAEELSIDRTDVVVASTGVIGQKLDLEPVKSGISKLAGGLGMNSSLAAEAIMTTDTKIKEAAVSFTIKGKECRIGGIAKGSGMINPNMATMLAFITTDCSISAAMLQKALRDSAKDSFNMISVDGDTSTNDMAVIMSNGLAGNPEIVEENDDFYKFQQALNHVTVYLSKMIASDGEGATKFLECKVMGAKTESAAKATAKAVVNSSLVKAAMFGVDPNWGRVMSAIGSSGADVDVNKMDISFKSGTGQLLVCENGFAVMYSKEAAKKILEQDHIQLLIYLKDGSFSATAYGCDLTYDYVRINAEYTT